MVTGRHMLCQGGEGLPVKGQAFLPLLRIIVADFSEVSCELTEISSCWRDADGWLFCSISRHSGNISLRPWCNWTVKCFNKPSISSLYRYNLPPISIWWGGRSCGISLKVLRNALGCAYDH